MALSGVEAQCVQLTASIASKKIWFCIVKRAMINNIHIVINITNEEKVSNFLSNLRACLMNEIDVDIASEVAVVVYSG